MTAWSGLIRVCYLKDFLTCLDGTKFKWAFSEELFQDPWSPAEESRLAGEWYRPLQRAALTGRRLCSCCVLSVLFEERTSKAPTWKYPGSCGPATQCRELITAGHFSWVVWGAVPPGGTDTWLQGCSTDFLSSQQLTLRAWLLLI